MTAAAAGGCRQPAYSPWADGPASNMAWQHVETWREGLEGGWVLQAYSSFPETPPGSL